MSILLWITIEMEYKIKCLKIVLLFTNGRQKLDPERVNLHSVMGSGFNCNLDIIKSFHQIFNYSTSLYTGGIILTRNRYIACCHCCAQLCMYHHIRTIPVFDTAGGWTLRFSPQAEVFTSEVKLSVTNSTRGFIEPTCRTVKNLLHIQSL